ncbi:MAG: NAD-dependent epimerase/dehydratase family protein [Desulfovibrio sp.]|jgi:CDP-paratose 2-epimerase|nr:NAD-dependent epimerase/dehydratase family protein [Desulfovibrio sp.]
MSVAFVTGSGGLIGSATVRFLCARGLDVVGVDNDARSYFFGKDAGTGWNIKKINEAYANYSHHDMDIRDQQAIDKLFSRYGTSIALVIHTAAQPSHDWAAREPRTDFSINADGTLNLLEAVRANCPECVFIFTSTNKVYGDTVNQIPCKELDTRFELVDDHPFAAHGVDESMGIDRCTHSLFGVSKAAADLLVQEYGRYFGIKTGIFRGGCLTGSDHSAARLHGFLGYLMKCALTDTPYTVFGYKGKQVRDNIHANDVVSAFWHFFSAPRYGEVYNIGGGRHSNISMLEAIAECERLTGKKMRIVYEDTARTGDHRWWISDMRKFQSHFPEWRYSYSMKNILEELREGMAKRSTAGF